MEIARLVGQGLHNGGPPRHALGDAANDLDEPLLFQGTAIAIPTLLALATELALKGLHMRTRGAAPRGHDLLELFERLPLETRRRLEQKMPGVLGRHPELESAYPSIRETFEANRSVFVEWRYMHEHLWLRADTSFVKNALGALIDTFEETNPHSNQSVPEVRHG